MTLDDIKENCNFGDIYVPPSVEAIRDRDWERLRNGFWCRSNPSEDVDLSTPVWWIGWCPKAAAGSCNYSVMYGSKIFAKTSCEQYAKQILRLLVDSGLTPGDVS